MNAQPEVANDSNDALQNYWCVLFTYDGQEWYSGPIRKVEALAHGDAAQFHGAATKVVHGTLPVAVFEKMVKKGGDNV